MERIFTKDVGKNFKRGQVKEYPITTWRDIAASVKRPLDSFSKPTDEAMKIGLEAVLEGKR